MQHPITVRGYTGGIGQLAQNVGNMRYDKVAEFIRCLADDLSRQADDDLKLRRRRQLAANLYLATASLRESGEHVGKAMDICRKHMKPEDLVG